MSERLPALHFGFLQKTVNASLIAECSRELGMECTPFSQMDTNVNFCDTNQMPDAVCFEQLGMIVYRPKSVLLATSKLFSHVFIEPGFQTYRAPQVAYTPRGIHARDGRGKSGEVDYLWALRETGVLNCAFDGSGVRVCVVDSGLQLHPDIPFDPNNGRSFTQGSPTRDVLGHGTFNAGIICGKKNPQSVPRFGVAPRAELFVAKVFGPSQEACAWSLVASIEWAIVNKCAVISMSIGEKGPCVTDPNGYIAEAAKRALALGTLIVAGVGNDSNRLVQPHKLRPVAFPANCAAVLAVGALQSSLQVTFDSNIAKCKPEGAVDIAAPGEDVQSAGIHDLHTTASGTSVATPFVAGVAALYAQACKVRGQALWDLVVAKARPLPNATAAEVGAGIVRAPQKGDACLCDPKPPC